jgi:hypothetical protein
MWATALGHVEVAKTLVANGADVEAKNDVSGKRRGESWSLQPYVPTALRAPRRLSLSTFPHDSMNSSAVALWSHPSLLLSLCCAGRKDGH